MEIILLEAEMAARRATARPRGPRFLVLRRAGHMLGRRTVSIARRPGALPAAAARRMLLRRRTPATTDQQQQGELTMSACVICHFETVLDDIVILGPGGRCVCLRCFGRETGTLLRMPDKLQRELTALLTEVPA